MNDHRYAWKMTAGLLCRFGTDWENSMLFASEAVVDGVVFVDGGCLRHTDTSVHTYAPYCNGIRLECCPVLNNVRRGGMRRASCARASYSGWKYWMCCHDRIILYKRI